MQPTGSHDELEAEVAAVARIEAAHLAHVRSARRYATGLAEEASFLSEEGPRETEAESGDEDGESAAEAATARAASARAVLAWKRVRELEAAGRALAFGRITGDDGDMYVGRMSVIDGDRVHLIDWRAAAAVPFYRATPLEPLGVAHRRHLHYTDGELTNYSDEVFDADALLTARQLRGEAALLADLARRTDGRMKSVVATIQAEQDAVIRASERGPLLVQGGPGTGKTVVALHRAAYLLYADRAALAETGVLIVGPSPEFLTYISDVLPSLGESGVVSMTVDQLHPGVRPVPDAAPERAALKGSAAMIKFLDAAVADRQRTPTT
ncbi:MAG: AAA family ATPase, partial [Acidimicrobiia bacterium]|nr:AAA family ATPase [Acidimicrobiia bacterium]